MSNGSEIGADLEMLDEFLMSENSPPDSMMLTDVDGFLTGIAVGPELIPPSEWMPCIWGGEQPVFTTKAEAKEIFGSIIKRYNEVLTSLDHGELDPIFMVNKEGDYVVSDWAEGFMQAVYLRRGAWEKLLTSEKDYSLIIPIAALCCNAEGKSLLDIDEKTENDFFEKAGDLVPEAVLAIEKYWRAQDKPIDPANVGLHQARNHPCACGSGKKYKKCCGLLH